MQPLIGVTTAVRKATDTTVSYLTAYTEIVKALETAGALPVLVPSNVEEATLRAIYQRLDGVLLPGGGDVHPSHYEEDLHPATDNIDLPRDSTEISLAQWAVADDLPVFGICRGHQVLNVALGGTLIQDIPTQVEKTDLAAHALPDGMPRNYRAHTITIDENSRLAGILGTTALEVNSIHHQSVKHVAPNTHITALSPDGVVEALEVPDKHFVLSVQWHPEDLIEDPNMLNLFRAFVAAARERMQIR